jgi:hypothetical protein
MSLITFTGSVFDDALYVWTTPQDAPLQARRVICDCVNGMLFRGYSRTLDFTGTHAFVVQAKAVSRSVTLTEYNGEDVTDYKVTESGRRPEVVPEEVWRLAVDELHDFHCNCPFGH